MVSVLTQYVTLISAVTLVFFYQNTISKLRDDGKI